MIWFLLQSGSPWQRNDAITFFIYLRVSLYQEFFLRNRLREFVPVIIASIMAKFEQILNNMETLFTVTPWILKRLNVTHYYAFVYF